SKRRALRGGRKCGASPPSPLRGRSSEPSAAAVRRSFPIRAVASWFSSAACFPDQCAACSLVLDKPTDSRPRAFFCHLHQPMNADELKNLEAILHSPSYLLAEQDTKFLQRPALRPVRLQLELLKPEMLLEEQQVRSTIVVFGSTQIIERDKAHER